MRNYKHIDNIILKDKYEGIKNGDALKCFIPSLYESALKTLGFELDNKFIKYRAVPDENSEVRFVWNTVNKYSGHKYRPRLNNKSYTAHNMGIYQNYKALTKCDFSDDTKRKARIIGSTYGAFSNVVSGVLVIDIDPIKNEDGSMIQEVSEEAILEVFKVMKFIKPMAIERSTNGGWHLYYDIDRPKHDNYKEFSERLNKENKRFKNVFNEKFKDSAFRIDTRTTTQAMRFPNSSTYTILDYKNHSEVKNRFDKGEEIVFTDLKLNPYAIVASWCDDVNNHKPKVAYTDLLNFLNSEVLQDDIKEEKARIIKEKQLKLKREYEEKQAKLNVGREAKYIAELQRKAKLGIFRGIGASFPRSGNKKLVEKKGKLDLHSDFPMTDGDRIQNHFKLAHTCMALDKSQSDFDMYSQSNNCGSKDLTTNPVQICKEVWNSALNQHTKRTFKKTIKSKNDSGFVSSRYLLNKELRQRIVSHSRQQFIYYISPTYEKINKGVKTLRTYRKNDLKFYRALLAVNLELYGKLLHDINNPKKVIGFGDEKTYLLSQGISFDHLFLKKLKLHYNLKVDIFKVFNFVTNVSSWRQFKHNSQGYCFNPKYSFSRQYFLYDRATHEAIKKVHKKVKYSRSYNIIEGKTIINVEPTDLEKQQEFLNLVLKLAYSELNDEFEIKARKALKVVNKYKTRVEIVLHKKSIRIPSYKGESKIKQNKHTYFLYCGSLGYKQLCYMATTTPKPPPPDH